MKKFLFGLLLANSFTCEYLGDGIKRCENKEAICYIYDTDAAFFTKSGRGSGISCKFKDKKDTAED